MNILEEYNWLDRLLSENIWTKKDGTFVHVLEMSDSHLTSTLNMLKRVGCPDTAISKFEKELDRRENASY